MQGPAKSDMSSQSWASFESTMDGSHFSDEMSDEVTIEQQRKEELAAKVPPSEGSVASGSSRRTEQWVDETCRERTNEAEEVWPNSNITNEPAAEEGCSREFTPGRGGEFPCTSRWGPRPQLHGKHEFFGTARVRTRSRDHSSLCLRKA